MSEPSNLFMDASMMELFREEVAAQAAAIENGLVNLESSPDAGKFEPLMRAAHSIKGAARIIGVDAAVGLAHLMEDLFVSAQNQRLVLTPELVDGLLKAVDVYKRLAAVKAADIMSWIMAHEGEFSAMKQALAAVASGGAAPAASSAAPPSPAPAPPRAEAAVPETPKAAQDSAVRITAETLNRLMGLAGESMVETRRIQSFSKRLALLKELHFQLGGALDRLHERASRGASVRDLELLAVSIKEQFAGLASNLGQSMAQFEEMSLSAEDVATRLYNEAIAARMRPFSDGIKGFPRLVRDLARQLDKRIALRVQGESTPVDRDILSRLEAPLTHILRNACDHGIERPVDRLTQGKPEEGSIRLEAAHCAGMLAISVTDDGRGIDPEAIRRKVLERRLADPAMVESMTDAELMEFLFLPGFSTSKTVTELSGRGVGMDVVQNMVQEVGGTVRMTSQPGKGSAVQLQLPLTLSVLRALIVEIAGELYAFHLSRIDRVLKVSRGDIRLSEDRQYVPFNKENIGLVPASQALGLEARPDPDGTLPVVIVSDRLNRYGLVVEALHGERELVVHPLDPRLGKIPNLSAASILEDGRPVLILDADDLVRTIDHMLSSESGRSIRHVHSKAASHEVRRILVVDDSITVREVERRLLENDGYHVDVAVDGMDGWNRTREQRYDLIITDVDMPRMNGIELVTRIRKDPDLGRLPVMIVSYKDREEDRLRGLDAGASYYLTKSSFHDASLLDAVKNLLGEG